MRNIDLTQMEISLIKSNENIIARLEVINNLMYDLKFNDSGSLFMKDEEGNTIDIDIFLDQLQNFLDLNINSLVRHNKQLFNCN